MPTRRVFPSPGSRAFPGGGPGAALPLLIATPGLVALVWDPARWLLRSWSDPSYQSGGMWIALLCAGLFAVSVGSGPASSSARSRRLGWTLLGTTAAIRLLGRLLDVNTVGALALALDVAALGVLLGVARRPVALHPAWLGALFCGALPVEHLAQRLLGHPLQLLAAGAAEALLHPVFPSLHREGVLLLHPDVALAVDLPCSGARGLALYSAIALLIATTRALTARDLLRGSLALGVGAFAANTLRIMGLFVGSAQGLPVNEEPWHSALGALALGFGALPLLCVGRAAPPRRGAPATAAVKPPTPLRLSWVGAVAIAAIGVAVSAAPHHPIDRNSLEDVRRLPTSLDAFVSFALPLRRAEQRYFEAWGGAAEKRVYDDGSGAPHTALLVRTRSPLRHLHGPDRCLIGAGHEATRMGVVAGALPTVLYRSVDPEGRVWRVESSFLSEGGARATTVSEVVWKWLPRRRDAWFLVQRVSPWAVCEAAPGRCRDFERALLASLDLAPVAAPRRTALSRLDLDSHTPHEGSSHEPTRAAP